MKVLILAAGYGTRLYPHTKNCPKPLLKVGEKPIINHLLDKIKRLKNISGIAIVTNDRFFKQFEAWGKTLNINYPIRLINDLTTGPDDRLGAIGDMHFAFSKEGFSGDFLVLGGDNLFKDGLGDFVAFAQRRHPYTSIGVCDIKSKKEACHYGVVSLDEKGRLTELNEKPEKPNSTLVAMCLYYFPQETLQLIEEYLSNPLYSHDTAGSYINWLSSRDRVYGFKFSDLWFDVGHIHTYKKVGKVLGGKR